MSDFTDFYKNLLILQYVKKTKASAEIELYAEEFENIYNFLSQYEIEFDLDNAVGDRLDKIGKIVGISRIVEGGILKKYFGYQGAANALAYGQGRYKTTDDSLYGDSELDDGQYRLFIRAKIAKNTASAFIATGDKDAIQKAIQILFENHAFVTDPLGMTLSLFIREDYPEDDFNLIEAADLIPRPQGVGYNALFMNDTPFGYLGASSIIAGYGEGRYVRNSSTPFIVYPPDADYNTFLFDGMSKYGDIDSTKSPTAGKSQITINAWVRGNSFSDPFGKAIYTEEYTAPSEIQVAFYILADGRLDSTYRSVSNGAFYKCTGVTSLSLNTWYMVSLVIDVNNFIKVYINGVLDNTQLTVSNAPISSDRTDVNIGRSADNGFDFDGSMTSFKVDSNAYSDVELLNLYQIGKTVYHETLPSNYTDNEELFIEMSSRDNSGNDLSGNTRNMTSQNGLTDDGALQTFTSYTP